MKIIPVSQNGLYFHNVYQNMQTISLILYNHVQFYEQFLLFWTIIFDLELPANFYFSQLIHIFFWNFV